MSTINPDQTITIALSVTDRKASAAWYETHLGFKELFSADEAGWSELATNTPGVTLGLGGAEEVTSSSTVQNVVFSLGGRPHLSTKGKRRVTTVALRT